MAPERIFRWKCDVCGRTYEVTHGYMPVGWASVSMDFSMGSDEDYDDCRRYGYKDLVRKKSVCVDCASAVYDALVKS